MYEVLCEGDEATCTITAFVVIGVYSKKVMDRFPINPTVSTSEDTQRKLANSYTNSLNGIRQVA
jgi:hypothetical protein